MADKQLAEEIEFDLKMLEEEQKKAAATKAATAAVSTPQAATPHAQMVSRYTHTHMQMTMSYNDADASSPSGLIFPWFVGIS